MILVPNLPRKVQFLNDIQFSLDQFLPWRSRFVGGRIGYDKNVLFLWLLVKKVLNWDYRTIADMAGMSHSTLVRANSWFLEQCVYERLFRFLIKAAYKQGLIQGKKVSLDSSFVHTFSNKREAGSLGWNGHKESYGFKLHLLIDAKTSFPMALIVGDGVTHDSRLAVPLLKKARPWLRKVGYVLADKGYDSTEIVTYIAKSLHAKAGIPIKETTRNKSYRRGGNFTNWRLKARGRTVKHSIYKLRSGIERCFSQLKGTFHLGKEHTRGITAFMKNTWLTLISYMFKRFWMEGSLCF